MAKTSQAWTRLQREHRKKRELFRCWDYEDARQYAFNDYTARIFISIDCDLGPDPGSRRFYVVREISDA